MSFPFDLHSAAASDSHLQCHAHATLRPRPQHSTAIERRPCSAVALRRTARSEHGMTSVNQTRPHCVNQMGKTHSKPLAARHGRGTAWARHGNGMLCVNRPQDVALRPLVCWNCWFESRRGHGCLPLVSVVCCQVEVCAKS